MEHIGIKISIPNGVTIMGASTRDDAFRVSPSLWEVRLGLRWTMSEGVNGVATLLKFSNHKYNALCERTNLYQIICSEFRYRDGKVLGTQPHPTHGSASIHCVSSLNLIKGTFNTLF